MSTCSINQTLAFGYVRLSKEDMKLGESESIANQKQLIEKFVAEHTDIALVDIFVDDGYSGTNYERPGFKDLIKALKEGKANCVIVKDLSRLGREYIQTGIYMQRLFPQMGVRFIAINDSMDSKEKSQADDLLIPIKNLMNDSYCRELSRKLRKQFRIQRSNGEFLGAFAAFGYLKSSDNKHKLVVDENAAEVVKGIFSLKLQGYSQQKIADRLNQKDILSPVAYKRQLGMKYKTSFGDENSCEWSGVSILRILRNRIYIGELIQGKRYKPNYKAKKTMLRDKKDWVVIEHNHEPIIDPWVFEAVQRALDSDTRCSDRSMTVAPLAGMVFCADCGEPMVQKTVIRGGKEFYYYVCKGNRMKNGCLPHSISVPKLESTVLTSLQSYISSVLELNTLLEQVNHAQLQEEKLRTLTRQLAEKQAARDKIEQVKEKLYEHLALGILEQDEYKMLKAGYEKQFKAAQEEIRLLEQKVNAVTMENQRNTSWIDHFLLHSGAVILDRETALLLIHSVRIGLNKQVEIEFACQDEYNALVRTLSEVKEDAQYGS